MIDPGFHPAVTEWFQATFPHATICQQRAWPAIKSGCHTLIAAPTGSGKTLAAFLCAIDDLVKDSIAGRLQERTSVLYLSPLKALGNDVQKNLDGPLQAIDHLLARRLEGGAPIRTMVRTGDTPAAAREAMRRHPPHILVTTPESLYILLTSEAGRRMLCGVRTVIVDEIHALVGNKRGAHLALSLARLDALCERQGDGRAPVRVGLSATQRPVEEVARFLVGSRHVHEGRPACHIIDTGHRRSRDLAIELPDSPLEALMSGEIWGEVYERLVTLLQEHRSTLVFVNTRRMAERLARALSERLGAEHVSSHHGSLARAQRLEVEQRLKRGQLKALVATASLELGIDVGDVDLVCQIGSPGSITSLLQRVGRSGHAVGGLPKGRLFPLSRDDLVECASLLDAVRRGEIDTLHIPLQPLDVLAQQLVAMCVGEGWDENDLHAVVTCAWPYRSLARETFTAVLRMLADGFTTRRGRRGAHLLRDAVNGRVRARRGARITAVTNGGAIPDNADYDVILEPDGLLLGSVNEDFAIESIPGDIFQLGNTSWRVLRVEGGRLRVEDAKGLPPNIPFWFGEAPGRSNELSLAVSRLRRELAGRLDESDEAAVGWLIHDVGVCEAGAVQLVDYLGAARAALGVLPDHDTLVLERFFDESGGMQLVVHSPRGSRFNRGLGLALRKRFCRSFNFELQAAATEDAVVLSLGETHSFELGDVARFLHPESVRDVLVQALLDAPMFTTRWRWNANVSLAVPRFRGGSKVPPHIQRMQAEDLVSVVFPDQIACLENLAGKREIPDHPLVQQTIADCLNEAMDVDALSAMLDDVHAGRIVVVAKDLTEPSPLSHEILTARPYAFLDDAPAEERRTRAVVARRWLDPKTATDLGRLEPEAIARVCEEAWPTWSDADELHDALCLLGFMTCEEAEGAQNVLQALADAGRACRLRPPGGRPVWLATEHLPEFHALLPGVPPQPPVRVPDEFAARQWTREQALVEVLRARLSALGPCNAASLAAPLGIGVERVDEALTALEREGFALRGSFTGNAALEWCERRLLARIHRYTMDRLRREIEPVSRADLLRFLCEWQQLGESARVPGIEGLAGALQRLDGFEAPAAAWERDLLPARVPDFDPAWLDNLCLSGRFGWLRLTRPSPETRASTPLRSTPIAIVERRGRPRWMALAASPAAGRGPQDARLPSSEAARVLGLLRTSGASFVDEVAESAGMDTGQVTTALAELVAAGSVSADGFAGLRALLARNADKRRQRDLSHVGRWSLLPEPAATGDRADATEHAARAFLARYGVVFRRLLDREGASPPWRDLLRVLRRLEARGEIRGGRFVAGFGGEQFALPEAIGLLREVRRRPPRGELLALGAADPLNLSGIVCSGARIPALASTRVLLRDGQIIASCSGGEVEWLVQPDDKLSFDASALLLRPRPPARMAGGTREQRPAAEALQ